LKKIQILKKLKTSENGLSEKEARDRLHKYGKNEIKEIKKTSAVKILWEQFNSFLIYILLAVAAVLLFIDLYHRTREHFIDAAVIGGIILFNAGIGFIQQYRAEKAIENLKKFILPKAKVLRDKKIFQISSGEVVPGDIIFFETGDKVCADARILSCDNFEANEAALTGESQPVAKESAVLSSDKPLAERMNMVFTGTQIVKGSCRAVVVNTGMETVFGQIAKTLQTLEDRKTPMQLRLDKFSKQLGFMILGLVAVVMVLGWFNGLNKLEMFFVAVTLAISAIPEGLPAVLAIAFSISASMLYKQKVIIRRLPAVETLGSVTVICSDKTGTITQEQMTVQKFFIDNKIISKNEITKKSQEFIKMLQTAVLCNDARYEIVNDKYELLGDPTEEALLLCSLDFGIDKISLSNAQPTVKKIEFDSNRKMMSKIRADKHDKYVMYTKGAPEKIIKACVYEKIGGEVKKITEKRRDFLMTAAQKMEREALRVLGMAYKVFSKDEKISETELIFQGFMGMQDPPRPEVRGAIKECFAAGIQVKMITGDSAVTAKAIACQIGIIGKIINEDELEAMTDAQLFDSIDEIAVFSRATPHQKLRIAKALQQKGHVVAMTGDGINDVLALKSADIGIAMGKRGTDVARDVSDIVLVDDNFASIAQGIKHGRRTYDNIKKFTKYILSVNFDTILLVGVLSALGMPLPITPLLVLWKNLVTDSFPALSLVFEPEEDVMKTPPRKEKTILKGIIGFIIYGGTLNFIACLIVYLIGLKLKNLSVPEVQTIVITTGVIFELLFVFVCRSQKPIYKIGFFTNKFLNIAVFSALAIHVVMLYSPLGSLFDVVPLTLNDWLFVLPFGLSGLIIVEITKFLKIKI
jgi:Ca2+-transporting ATPase